MPNPNPQSNPLRSYRAWGGKTIDVSKLMALDSDNVMQPTDDGKALLKAASGSVRKFIPPDNTEDGTVLGSDDQLTELIGLADARVASFQGTGSTEVQAVIASWNAYQAAIKAANPHDHHHK